MVRSTPLRCPNNNTNKTLVLCMETIQIYTCKLLLYKYFPSCHGYVIHFASCPQLSHFMYHVPCIHNLAWTIYFIGIISNSISTTNKLFLICTRSYRRQLSSYEYTSLMASSILRCSAAKGHAIAYILYCM